GLLKTYRKSMAPRKSAESARVPFSMCCSMDPTTFLLMTFPSLRVRGGSIGRRGCFSLPAFLTTHHFRGGVGHHPPLAWWGSDAPRLRLRRAVGGFAGDQLHDFLGHQFLVYVAGHEALEFQGDTHDRGGAVHIAERLIRVLVLHSANYLVVVRLDA